MQLKKFDDYIFSEVSKERGILKTSFSDKRDECSKQYLPTGDFKSWLQDF